MQQKYNTSVVYSIPQKRYIYILTQACVS